MSDEVRRIQQMIDEGKVTPEEGKELIASVAEKPPAPPAMPDLAPAAPEIRASWILWPLVSHGIILAAIVLMLTAVTPKFKKIVLSFGAELPSIMVLIFGLSAMAMKWFLLLVPVLVAFLGGDLAVYVLLRRHGSRGLATLWWWAVSLVLTGAFMVLALGLGLPLVQLLRLAENAARSG